MSHHLIAEAAQKALDCSRLCQQSELSERAEVKALITLMGTWTLEGEALDQVLERLQELRSGPSSPLQKPFPDFVPGLPHVMSIEF